MAERIERARLRDMEKAGGSFVDLSQILTDGILQRAAYHEQLITHSNAGRLTSQDAVLHKTPVTSINMRPRNPDALLTLPDFIREAIPDTVEQARDPEMMLTLPEFVREPPPSLIVELGNNGVGMAASKFMKKPLKPHETGACPLHLCPWLGCFLIPQGYCHHCQNQSPFYMPISQIELCNHQQTF